MAMCQAITIKSSIDAGRRAAQWWLQKLTVWVARDDWDLVWNKVIPGSSRTTRSDQWAHKIMSWIQTIDSVSPAR